MNKLIKPAVLSISLLTIMTGSAVSPALSQISKSFPNVNLCLIRMIVTLPSLIIIPFSLLSGKISNIIRKRKIIITGLIIYILGGVGGGFSTNIKMLLFSRMILGVGMGLLIPFSTSLIADFFKGNERIKMIGYSNAVSNLGGIVSTLAAGWLAIYNWRYVFGVYLIAVAVLVLVFWGLPEPPKRSITNIKNNTVNNKVIFLALLAFLLNIAFYSVIINISLLIENEHLGNSGSSGIAISILTLAGFISGIYLSNITLLLKKWKVPVAVSFLCIGFLLLSAVRNMYILLISTFLIGFGLGILKPTIFLKATKVTPKYSNAFAISIISSSILLGKFVSPFFNDLLIIIFKSDEFKFIFKFTGISLGCVTIISLICILMKKEQSFL